MEKMHAAIVYGINDLRLEKIDIPSVPANSFRVKVKSCAICGTDRRIYRKGDYRAAYPVIVGHEIAGVVDALAPGVTTVKNGDRVCVAPGHGCGKCIMCTRGYPNVCTSPYPSLGYKLNGGFSEYMAVPEHIFRLGFVNKIPDSLSYDQASMSEIIACCINAQGNAQVQKGETVLVMGCGPAGIVHAHLSKLAGAEKVIVTQRSRYRLDSAKSLFSDVIDSTIVSSENDLSELLLQETNGHGADVIYVCAPSREAQEQAFTLIANRGRINFFGGLPADDCIVKLNSNDLHYKEFFISGASSSTPEGNRRALDILADRKIDPDKLITHSFALDDIKKGFDILEDRKCIKIVINP